MPLPPVAVVHPYAGLARASRSRRATGLPYDDVVTVGRPGRLEEFRSLVFHHGARVRAVGVHDPEVVLPVPIGDERNCLPVGRVAGVITDRDSGVSCQKLRLTTRDRDPIDATEEVEGDPLAVWGHVGTHPRALVGREVDLVRVATGDGDVPSLRGFLSSRGLDEQCEKKCAELR